MTPRILVTGSRHWTPRRDQEMQDAGELPPGEGLQHIMVVALDTAWRTLGKPNRPILVHGACPYGGADAMADALWTLWGWPTEPHPADFALLGRAAGRQRNGRMVDLGADLCLAFPLPGSRGTKDCVRRAEAAGIPVRICGPLAASYQEQIAA